MRKHVGDRRRLRFFPQLVLVMGLMGAMFAGLIVTFDRGVVRVPFSWEQAAVRYITKYIPMPFSVGQDEVSKAWSRDLQKLIDNLAASMDMNEDIEIHVDYSPDQIVNAVAIFGGQVVVFDGLLNLADSENALSFVLAHEIAHLKHRDALRSMSREGLVFSGLMIIFGTSGDLGDVVQFSSRLTSFKYSRDIETAADEEAIDTLAAYYGHVNGMDQIFKSVMKLAEEDKMPPEFLSTHPEFKGRIAHMYAYAESKGYLLEGELTPMAFANLKSSTEDCDKSLVLCRIEGSIDRIRNGHMSLVDPDPSALDDAIAEVVKEDEQSSAP